MAVFSGTQSKVPAPHPDVQSKASRLQQKLVIRTAITSLALVLLLLYLMPLGYSVLTSLKTKAQVSDINAPILPSEARTYTYQGETYDIYNVPTEDGVQEWALVQRGRNSSTFVDPANPETGEIEWEGRWRTLIPSYERAFAWENYPQAFGFINFMRLLGYTLMYAGVTTIGATFSAAIVAYGFARFRFPFKGVLFMVLISTIILPPQVTLVPTYAFFYRIGWVGTWLPLIVPQFFSNAYNVFLLRQYFMTIPTSMEEAARIDGAGPIRTFVSVILPQAVPALIAVALFHFFFTWNDFFGPLIYLAGSADLLPLAVGLFRFNGLFSSEPQLIQAASILTMMIPLLIFFMAQRFFMQGIVVTGDK